VQGDVANGRENLLGHADGGEVTAVVLSALRRWVEGRSGGDAKAVEAWRSQLRDGSPLVRAVGSQLPDALRERFAAVVQISQRMEAAPSPNRPETLQHWLTLSRAIRGLWPPTSARDWEVLIGDLSAQGNLLVDALVADALAAALRSNQLDRATRGELAPLLQPSLAWSRTIPLPPAPGRSWRADDCVLLWQDADACDGLDAMTAAIAERLTGIHTKLVGLVPPSGDRRIVDSLDANCRSVRAAHDTLRGIVATGRKGWPVELVALQAAVEAICSALIEFSRAARPLTMEHDDEAMEWASQLRASCERLCAVHEPSHASCDSDHRVALLACPAVSETRLGKPAVPPNAEEPPATWHGRITAHVDELRRSDDPVAGALLPRLTDLAAAWQAVECSPSDELRDDARRQLLGCLIMLDDRLERPPRPAWLGQLRGDLQAILADEGTYRIVGPDLIGRVLTGRDSLAEVCGQIESKTVKSGGVAQVQRPGYAMRSPDGRLVVLRKARVLLAK
jgi:hypothetical protein